MKKLMVWLMLLALAVSGACAENAYTDAFDSMKALVFDTQNVTVTLNAEFKVDGEVFKVLRGEYRQDDYDSFLEVMLDTPYGGGEVYTGGYTVIGNNDRAYARDTYFGNYFTVTSTEPANTLLTKTSSLNAASLLMESVLSMLSEEGVKAADGKTVFTLSEAPEILNSALTYFLSDYIEENYYFTKTPCEVFFNSMDALIATEYEKTTGEKMPETFIDEAYAASYEDEAWKMYETLYNSACDRINKEAEAYEGGILHVSDAGETRWFASYHDYLVGTEQTLVEYEDYAKTFAAYYESRHNAPYGETEEMILAYTQNFELWEAHVEEMVRMEDEFRRIADESEGIVLVKVLSDGTVEKYERLPEAYEISGETIARRLMKNLYQLKLNNMEIAVEKDEADKISVVSGSAEVDFYREDGQKNTVSAEFVFTAGAYGETSVDEFDAADYGSCMYEEYIESTALEPDMPAEEFSEEEYMEMLKKLPAQIEYAGTVYDTMIYTGE